MKPAPLSPLYDLRYMPLASLLAGWMCLAALPLLFSYADGESGFARSDFFTLLMLAVAVFWLLSPVLALLFSSLMVRRGYARRLNRGVQLAAILYIVALLVCAFA